MQDEGRLACGRDYEHDLCLLRRFCRQEMHSFMGNLVLLCIYMLWSE